MKKLKKLLFFAAMLTPALSYGSFDVQIKPCASAVIGSVSVSTITPTQLSVGSSNLPGRTWLEIVNADAAYSISVGTFPTITAAAGYIVTTSTSASGTASVSWPIGTNITLYGIGAANNVQSTVNVRLMECAQ